MISLKRYLDSAETQLDKPEKDSAQSVSFALLSAYRSALAEIGECSANACPDLVSELKRQLTRLDEDLGEPPTAKGYTPSVFSRLAKLVERAGNFRSGSITAFYTTLMEGDDQQDPLVDAVRSLLDGHVVLSRRLAAEGWYPPIDLLDSIMRSRAPEAFMPP